MLAGMEAALVFSSGYLANMGVITALGGPGTLIVADEHCHASMIDGFRLSRSRTESFTHNSVEEAGRLLGGPDGAAGPHRRRIRLQRPRRRSTAR